MAAQTDASSVEISAKTVGNAFVSQFYNYLHSSPELVYKFYQDSSTMSRPGPDGTLLTVTSMDAIKDVILSLDCQDYQAEILTADAQASYMNGVIVLVTGCLTGKDNVRRKFTESFFLAPQENGYFVLNDEFRFIEEESSSVVPLLEKDVDTSELAAPVTIEVLDATVNQTPAVNVENKAVSISKDEHKATVTESVVPQASVDAGQKAQPVAETLPNGHVDAPKLSYRSKLLNNGIEGGSMSIVSKPANATIAATVNGTKKTAQQTRETSVPSVQQTHATSVPTAASGSSAPNGSNGSVTDQAGAKGGHSIYVGGLPANATREQVEHEFKRLGGIRSNGVQVRSNKGYCFGFVEFEDASGKQKAIQMGKIVIGGKEAVIEEKQTDTKVINGVSVYPSGRGGYRNDGYRNDGHRGRGNFSNGGRGHLRNDYGRRNGEVPSRGSRNGDGFGYQNGGGRGAQVAAPK